MITTITPTHPKTDGDIRFLRLMKEFEEARKQIEAMNEQARQKRQDAEPRQKQQLQDEEEERRRRDTLARTYEQGWGFIRESVPAILRSASREILGGKGKVKNWALAINTHDDFSSMGTDYGMNTSSYSVRHEARLLVSTLDIPDLGRVLTFVPTQRMSARKLWSPPEENFYEPLFQPERYEPVVFIRSALHSELKGLELCDHVNYGVTPINSEGGLQKSKIEKELRQKIADHIVNLHNRIL